MKNRIPLISLIFLCLTPASGNEFHSPRSAALGGAGHANPLLNDAVYMNPSFASFLPVYSWSGNFKALGDSQGRAYSLSVLDGRSELFQASAGYLVRDDFSALHLGASKKVQDTLTVGVGAKFFFSKNPAALQNGRNFNLSATYAPLTWLQFSALADNLLVPSNTSSLGLQRELVIGSKLKAAEKLMLYVDPHFRLSKITEYPTGPAVGYQAGVEVGIFTDFYLRAGSFKNVVNPEIRAQASGFGYGVGWVAPRLSFDFAIERVRSPRDELITDSGLTLYF